MPIDCNISYNAKCASFFASCCVSFLTLVFCFVKMFMLKAGEDKAIYIGIIMTMIGVFLPQPKLPEKDINNLALE